MADIGVAKDSWLTNRTIAELDLPAEEVLVLGVRRNNTFIGAPQSETEIKPGDTLVLYGKHDRLQELSGR